MKRTSLFFAVMFMAFTAFSQTWVSDGAHSRLGFSVKHLLISEVIGNFKKFEVKAVTTKPEDLNAKIELTAEIGSINTDNDKRDEHLKGVDFFDAAQFSKLTFTSTSLKKISQKNFKLIGNLTLHGITKPTTLDLVFVGKTTNPMNKKEIAVFTIKGVLKRSDFAIGAKFPVAVVSDEVEVFANVEMKIAE
jgi:polyisoprenoid-binding protein YceI